MLFHLFKYRFKVLIRQRVLMFWSLLFPLLLGTLFFLAFGKASTKREVFSTIPVAVVTENVTSEDTALLETMKELKAEDGTPMFEITEGSKEEADTLLAAGKVSGTVIPGTETELLVRTSGLNQTILKSFLSQYKRIMAVYADVIQVNPAAVADVTALLSEDTSYLQNVTLGGEEVDSMFQYFYALLAMTCLYGSFFGMQNAEDIMANESALGARRNIAPTHHLKQAVADMFAAFTVHFINTSVVLVYLVLVLRIQFVSQTVLFLTVILLGCIIGVCLGQFIGCAVKKSETLRVALALASTMIMSILSGLMFSGLKYTIDQSAPIVNRLNPAALVTDAFYCLSVYNDYERYTSNVITIAVLAVLLMFGTYLSVRRSKYASL